ncbi:MAG: nickel-dependent hydrogenase large subunit [Candidatus Altiarchaeota archaeon]|nr:nickel-dependent hydrogenase large subunit [Candidatus Altiarchaeota archaeon]
MRVEVPLGTIHPALIEPFRTRLWIEDEVVVDCEITYNAAHRGIERILEGVPVLKASMIVEKVCGLCSHFHLWNSIRATEKALGVTPTERAEYIRVLVAELERIHSHLFFIGHACEVLGHETFVYRAFEIREPLMRILYELTGNRVHYAVPVVGGVRPRANPSDETLKKVTGYLNDLEPKLNAFVDRFMNDPLVMSRVTGAGILRKSVAEEMYAVGPTARASGVNNDVRLQMPEYKPFEYKTILLKDGDNKARVALRCLEMYESVKIIRQVLDKLPSGPVVGDVKLKFDTEFAQAYIEAPRGELYHILKVDAKGKVRNYRIRTPTPSNLASMEKACVGDHLTDAVLTIASCDPCLSCSSRALVVDNKTGKERVFDYSKGVSGR